jgi:CRISPR-associated protein GSU0053 (Cas_GSU0053)
LAGPGAPIKPAIYACGVYQHYKGWRGEGEKRQPVDAIVIDNVPSQANRPEAALRGLRSELGLPEIVLDLAPVGALPPHLPTRLSSHRFPYRQADAYLRHATLGGDKFLRTEVGAQVRSERAAPTLRPPSDEPLFDEPNSMTATR